MIDWSKQHCGVHRASAEDLLELMPDVAQLCVETFPDPMGEYSWDVKVHMLMPSQYPCIPNWHYDHVPRINNKQDFSKVRTDLLMWLWISGEPLAEFKRDGIITPVHAETWKSFTQADIHRGTVSHAFQWRGFIRATPIEIVQPIKNCLRRHSQVYLDAESFRW